MQAPRILSKSQIPAFESCWLFLRTLRPRKKAGRAAGSNSDTPLTTSTRSVAEVACASVVYLPKQSKPTGNKHPKEKCTVLEWVRAGYRFPGQLAPFPVPLPPEPTPEPEPEPKKPGEGGGQ